MIEQLSTTNIPIQQRSTYNEGVKSNPATKVNNGTENRNQDDKKDSVPVGVKHKEKVEEIVKGLNDFLKPTHTSIQFKLHEKLHEYYVTIVDDDKHEVIKEIPAKKLLDTYATMAEYLGLLVDKKI